jgi:hypothetical protein
MRSRLLCVTACLFYYIFLARHSVQAVDHAAANVRSHEYYRICPLPKCEKCPSTDELRAPAVGLALETAHG